MIRGWPAMSSENRVRVWVQHCVSVLVFGYPPLVGSYHCQLTGGIGRRNARPRMYYHWSLLDREALSIGIRTLVGASQ